MSCPWAAMQSAPSQPRRSNRCGELKEPTARLAGRVDITNGERKYLLLRDNSSGEDRWYAVNERSQVVLFDRAQLETILQDLWS